MTWSSWVAALLLTLGLVAGAAAAAEQFEIEVMVSQIGDGPDGIDPRGGKLHDKIRKQFRYESLKVLKTKSLKLGLDEVAKLSLPNGKPLIIRPLQLTDRGLLLATHIGDTQADLKVTRGRLFVIDAGRHKGDKLVVSFDVDW